MVAQTAETMVVQSAAERAALWVVTLVREPVEQTAVLKVVRSVAPKA